MGSDAMILPGVGAFSDAMNNLRKLDLVSSINEFIATGKPFMGICLGMQLLMTESEEFGNNKGLDIIKGSVVRFPTENSGNKRNKIPQVGWNQIFLPSFASENFWDNSPLQNIRNGEFMYFVHSYYPVPADTETVLSTTNYEGAQFCSSILWRNIFAVQYHPEKSASEGIRIYENWALMVRREAKNDRRKIRNKVWVA
jgi:glutamine amidotransferase